MYLKKRYDSNKKLIAIDVKKHTAQQKFSQEMVNDLIDQGFITLGQGALTLHSNPELKYNIVTTPGYFCCHDDKKFTGEKEIRRYVNENYSGVESPDSNNPSGYRRQTFYFCELVEG